MRVTRSTQRLSRHPRPPIATDRAETMHHRHRSSQARKTAVGELPHPVWRPVRRLAALHLRRLVLHLRRRAEPPGEHDLRSTTFNLRIRHPQPVRGLPYAMFARAAATRQATCRCEGASLPLKKALLPFARPSHARHPFPRQRCLSQSWNSTRFAMTTI